MAVTLHERIGSGGFGTVYRATDDLNRTVAVKVISRSAAQSSSALEHARALARVDHPHVVTIYRVEAVTDPEDGLTADGVVMEFVDGPTLASRVATARLSVDELRAIGLAIISAMKALHDNGVAHRDLHEDNVLLGSKGVKVIDVLYREQDSLRLLSGRGREELLGRDLEALRRLITFAIRNSELKPAQADGFARAAVSAADVEGVGDAFRAVLETPSPLDTESPAVLTA
ncbi:MAG: protein kinase [Gemmatimonadota bacterium]